VNPAIELELKKAVFPAIKLELKKERIRGQNKLSSPFYLLLIVVILFLLIYNKNIKEVFL